MNTARNMCKEADGEDVEREVDGIWVDAGMFRKIVNEKIFILLARLFSCLVLLAPKLCSLHHPHTGVSADVQPKR